jgi:hypothetical protein
VESLRVETIEIGKNNKKKKETVLVLNFSGALSDLAAGNAGVYELAAIIEKKAAGKGKNRKPASTKLGAPESIESAVFNAADNSVTLTPRDKVTGSEQRELIVDGMLLTDTLGRDIDGAGDGQAGSDFIATIDGNRVTVGGIALARAKR